MNIQIVGMLRSLVDLLAQNYGKPIDFNILLAAMRIILKVEEKLDG